MKKLYTFLIVAFILSLFMPGASAANKAMKVTLNDYDYNTKTDYRFVVSTNAIGHGTPITADDSFSVGFWVNRTATMGGSGITTSTLMYKSILLNLATKQHENANGAFVLTVDEEGALSFVEDCWGHKQSGTGGSIGRTMSLNTWYYMLVTVDNKARKFRLYIDKELVYDRDMTGPVTYAESGEDPAAFHFGGYGFAGMYDNVAVYNRALDEDEALVSYYAPEKLTDEINALYEFEEGSAGRNSVADGNSYDAQYELATFGVLGVNGFMTISGTSTYSAVSMTAVDSYDKPAIPIKTIIIPERTYENATVVIKDKDGNELRAGDEVTYEFGDKFLIEVTGINDYMVIDAERLGRHLSASDHIYLVYDEREWRDINLTLKKRIVAMTVENEAGLDYSVAYGDNSPADASALEYGKTVVVTVRNTADASLDGAQLNGADITGNNGVFTFERPDEDFTFTILGHANAQYRLLVARTEGGTVTVTDQDGNNVASGSEDIYEGSVLTITTTAEDGYNTEITYNYTTAVTSGYSVEVHGDVTFSVVFSNGAAGDESCEPRPIAGRANGSKTSRNDRVVTKLTVSDGTSSIEIAGTGTGSREVYADHTSSILTTEPGKTISVTVAGAGEWMQTYIYADFDGNGLNPGDEVVNNYVDEKYCNQIAGTYTFTVPADIAPGSYRVRYMLNWDNNQGPCSYGQRTKDNGETVIDFMLAIGGTTGGGVGGDTPVYMLTINVAGNGRVEAWSGENGTGIQYENGEGLYANAPIYFRFVAADGEEVEAATVMNNGVDENGDTEGNFTEHIVAGDVEATGVFSSNVSGLDGVEADDATAPSVYYNLQGVRVGETNLTTGFYIRRQGKRAERVFIKK